MPLTKSLFHPRMLSDVAESHFPSFCSVYDTDDTTNAIGETIRVRQSMPLPGVERIRCNLSQVLGRGADFSEQRAPESTYVAQQYECQLIEHVTAVQEDMIAVVDDVEYNIRGVKQPSLSSHTVLLLERIR